MTDYKVHLNKKMVKEKKKNPEEVSDYNSPES